MARVFGRLRQRGASGLASPFLRSNPFARSSTFTQQSAPFSSAKATTSTFNLRTGVFAISTSAALAGALASPLYADGGSGDDGIFATITAPIRSLLKPFSDAYADLNEALCGDQSILLPPLVPDPYGRPVRTVCVNFEKTLVYPTWTREYGWVIRKRPYVSQFLERVARAGYEVVLFTDSNQFDIEGNVMELDAMGAIKHKLYKDATNFKSGCYVKDLSRLGRDLKSVVIIDHNYLDGAKLQLENAFKVSEWKEDLKDKELYKLMIILEKAQKHNVHDMRDVVRRYNENPDQNIFAAEEARARQIEQQLAEEEGGSVQPSQKSGGGGSMFGGLFGRKH